MQILKDHEAYEHVDLTYKHIAILEKRPGNEEIKFKD